MATKKKRSKTKPPKPDKSLPDFNDPDEAPPWADDVFERAEFAIGGKVIRPVTGTLTKKERR